MFCLHVFSYTTCVQDVHGGQKKVSDPLELELIGCEPLCGCCELNLSPLKTWKSRNVFYCGAISPAPVTNTLKKGQVRSRSPGGEQEEIFSFRTTVFKHQVPRGAGRHQDPVCICWLEVNYYTETQTLLLFPEFLGVEESSVYVLLLLVNE